MGWGTIVNTSLRRSCGLVFALLAGSATAKTASLPAGSLVYGELDEKVTSRIEKDGWDQGDSVRAHVWRDVSVGGVTVIKAGTPMMVRISEIKKAKMAGPKGKLELEAVSTTSADGDLVPLTGGYDKSGHGRMGLSISLAAVVAWPLIFIKGKAAILDAGTVFDATTEAPIDATPAPDAMPKIRLADTSTVLQASVLYDEMDPDGKSKFLPLHLESCTGPIDSANVLTVNGHEIPSIPASLAGAEARGDCHSVHASIDLKELGKHFAKGINRFEVETPRGRAEIVMDIEL
jgi:hypothetical protein